MGGSRRIARLAFAWGLIACGATATMQAQSVERLTAARAQVAPTVSTSQSFNSEAQSVTLQSPAAPEVQPSATRAGPWLPQPWQSAQANVPHNNASLGDNHTFVISTAGIIIVGLILLLLLR